MSWVECKTEADLSIAYQHLKEIELWADIRDISWFNEGWCIKNLTDWDNILTQKTTKTYYIKNDKDETVGSFIFRLIQDHEKTERWVCMGTNFDDMTYQEADNLIYPFFKDFINGTDREIVFFDSWIKGQLVAPERTDLIKRMESYGIKITISEDVGGRRIETVGLI